MIGTLGPGRVWGGGGAPAGPPDVVLTSANTVVEDGNRAGPQVQGGAPAVGQSWYYQLVNPAHDACEIAGSGPRLGINDGTLHNIQDWAPTIAAVQGVVCPTGGAPTLTGYLGPLAFAGVFEFGFTADYCNACGPIVVDESFTLNLWGPL